MNLYFVQLMTSLWGNEFQLDFHGIARARHKCSCWSSLWYVDAIVVLILLVPEKWKYINNEKKKFWFIHTLNRYQQFMKTYLRVEETKQHGNQKTLLTKNLNEIYNNWWNTWVLNTLMNIILPPPQKKKIPERVKKHKRMKKAMKVTST